MYTTRTRKLVRDFERSLGIVRDSDGAIIPMHDRRSLSVGLQADAPALLPDEVYEKEVYSTLLEPCEQGDTA